MCPCKRSLVPDVDLFLLLLWFQPILFHQFCKSYHPRMIYLVVSSVDEALKCFFSSDALTSYSMLVNRDCSMYSFCSIGDVFQHHQEIRLVMSKTDPDGKFLANIQSRLSGMFQSAQDLYKKFVDDPSPTVFVNSPHHRRIMKSLFITIAGLKMMIFDGTIISAAFYTCERNVKFCRRN